MNFWQCYMHFVFLQNILQVHNLSTGAFIKSLPLDMGTITGYSGDRKYPEIFYQFTSFLSPGIIYRCDLSNEDFIPSVSTCKSILTDSSNISFVPVYIIVIYSEYSE